MSEITGYISIPFHGEAGESAYEIAKKYGYTGTEEEWVNSLGFIPDKSIGKEKLDNELEALIDKKVNMEDIYKKHTVVIPATEASPNLLNPEAEVAGYNVYRSSTTNVFGRAAGDNYSYVVIPIIGGHQYKVVPAVGQSTSTGFTLYWASGDSSDISDLTCISVASGFFGTFKEDETYIATAPENAQYAVYNNKFAYPMIYDYTEHGLLTNYEEYREATPETTTKVYKVKEELLPDLGLSELEANVDAVEAEISEAKEILADATTWEDVTSEWQAGYMWLADGTYHKITDDETIYSNEAKSNICATPQDKPIAVSAGEEWHIKLNVYVGNIAKAVVIFDDNDNLLWSMSNLADATEGVYFTIPEGGTKMYITFFNNQTYWLKKKAKKSAAEMLADIDEKDKAMLTEALDAHYRTYRRNRSTLKDNDKAYVIFMIDDCRQDMDLIADVFETKGIPLCSATIPGNLKNSASNGEETRLDVCRRIVANGGEILAHYGSTLTSDNFSFEECYKRFYGNKKTLESYGFDVNGIILDGGTGQGSIDFYEAEKWASYFYSYSDLYGVAEPYHHPRVSLRNKDLAWFTEQVATAIANKAMVVFFFHDTKELSIDVLTTMLEHFLTLSADDIEAVTYKEYYDKVSD